jgi:hypothetical protein
MPEPHILPPPRRRTPYWPPGQNAPHDFEPLPSFDDLTGKTTEHEHRCGVGGRPREGQAHIRQCRCGMFYQWNGGSWYPMGPLNLWLHRRQLAEGLDEFFADMEDGPWDAAANAARGWRPRMPTAYDLVTAWRMLRMFLRDLSAR